MREIHVVIGLRATSRTARHGTEREKHILTRGKSVEEVHGMFVFQTTGSSERNGRSYRCDVTRVGSLLLPISLILGSKNVPALDPRRLRRNTNKRVRSYEFAERLELLSAVEERNKEARSSRVLGHAEVSSHSPICCIGLRASRCNLALYSLVLTVVEKPPEQQTRRDKP
jgi:hypothetical protein